MAEIVLFTPEQLAERERKPKGQGWVGRRRSPERTRIIEEYKVALQQTQPGYGGDVLLPAGEDKRVVRQNLQAAAEELNLALDFRPIRDKTRLQFRVITPEERAAKPKRGGRPRKQQPEEHVAVGAVAGPVQELAHEQPAMAQDAPPAPPNKRTRHARAA